MMNEDLANQVKMLKEKLGFTRMCLNCGKMVDAKEIKRGDELPECIGPEGLSACTFDLTPQEAWLHWREVAHERREETERLKARAEVAEAEVERLRGERDANHNLAIANGSRAKEEEARAEAAQAEVERVRRLYREAIQLADAHRRRAEAAEARVAELDRDIGILIASLEFLAEATGEGLDREDAALVYQIKADHERRRAILSLLPKEA